MRGKRRVLSVWSILAVLMVLLGGCGGGGGGSAAPAALAAVPEEMGQIIIALTDAEGDFDSYTVDVTSISLQRADGTVVETLPFSTRVDFAELTEVTEFLSIATVPAGRYRSARLGLDFSNAQVIVQDELGDLHEATLLDETGQPLTTLDVVLQLTDSDSIVIRPGIPAAFSLDFDLDASNSIDLTTAPPRVTVMPFLLASAELESDRAHRVRGVLASVDEAAASVTLAVRPFRHRRGDFGRFTFHTSDETLYEIDGVGYAGAAGLSALALLDGVPVVAGGNVNEGRLQAETVLAGTSVPWTEHDVARGVVKARTDDVLTLSGVVVEYADGIVARRGELTVLIGDATSVTALGLDNDTLTKNSISVGQRITAFGDLVDDLTLDATEDHVRMQISQLTADVVETGALVVDLHYLNGRRPEAFDFTGTGMDAANDADPTHYQVDTATLPLASVEPGDLVRVRGHVNAFGAAPDDFLALTVIDVSLDMRSASFLGYWPIASAEAVVSIDPDRIELDLTEARSVLKIRGVPVTVSNPLDGLVLQAPADRRGVYAVYVHGADEIHLYREFSALSDEVLDQLQTGSLLHLVGAHGRYNRDTDALVTGRAVFQFVESGE